ncbi:MAG: hypothetical protein KatS3mg008_1250 [Acidimicrobiales bacterium]|nr:MAG: hypothetical protein KatS3mg008_1250 [Acidimicrobiales bacterium]
MDPIVYVEDLAARQELIRAGRDVAVSVSGDVLDLGGAQWRIGSYLNNARVRRLWVLDPDGIEEQVVGQRIAGRARDRLGFVADVRELGDADVDTVVSVGSVSSMASPAWQLSKVVGREAELVFAEPTLGPGFAGRLPEVLTRASRRPVIVRDVPSVVRSAGLELTALERRRVQTPRLAWRYLAVGRARREIGR